MANPYWYDDADIPYDSEFVWYDEDPTERGEIRGEGRVSVGKFPTLRQDHSS